MLSSVSSSAMAVRGTAAGRITGTPFDSGQECVQHFAQLLVIIRHLVGSSSVCGGDVSQLRPPLPEQSSRSWCSAWKKEEGKTRTRSLSSEASPWPPPPGVFEMPGGSSRWPQGRAVAERGAGERQVDGSCHGLDQVDLVRCWCLRRQACKNFRGDRPSLSLP